MKTFLKNGSPKAVKKPLANTKGRNFSKEHIEYAPPVQCDKAHVDVDVRVLPADFRARLPNMPLGSCIRMTRALAHTHGCKV